MLFSSALSLLLAAFANWVGIHFGRVRIQSASARGLMRVRSFFEDLENLKNESQDRSLYLAPG